MSARQDKFGGDDVGYATGRSGLGGGRRVCAVLGKREAREGGRTRSVAVGVAVGVRVAGAIDAILRAIGHDEGFSPDGC